MVTYNVGYRKLAQNKILQKEPISQLDVLVKGTGFKLIGATFTTREIKLNVDKLKRHKKGRFYFLPSQQEINIQNQLKSGLKLERILKDTVHMELGSLSSKKVPVVAQLDIRYQLGFDRAAPILISPDSVVISGPELQLDNIDKVETAVITIENVGKSIERVVTLNIPQPALQLKMNTTQVRLKILVDKFTEGEFLVPFDIKNIPSGTKINTFPKKVKLTFKVGLKNFNKVTAESFKVVCDYKVSKEEGLTYLIPTLVATPTLISSVRIEPKRIDYLVLK